MDRRDFIKGMTIGGVAVTTVGRHLVTGDEAVHEVIEGSPIAALEQAGVEVSEPVKEMVEGEVFTPMVIESEFSLDENIYPHRQVGVLSPVGFGFGRREISGRFTMYVEDIEKVRLLTETHGPHWIEVHQGPWKHRFNAYINSVSIQASPHELITADVNFVATEMNTVEA